VRLRLAPLSSSNRWARSRRRHAGGGDSPWQGQGPPSPAHAAASDRPDIITSSPQFLLDAWQKAGVRNPPVVQSWKLETTPTRMDRAAGVATAILSAGRPGLNLPGPQCGSKSAAAARAWSNEHVVEAMKEHPGRFGLVRLCADADRLTAALKEIEYAPPRCAQRPTHSGQYQLRRRNGWGIRFQAGHGRAQSRKAIVYVQPAGTRNVAPYPHC